MLIVVADLGQPTVLLVAFAFRHVCSTTDILAILSITARSSDSSEISLDVGTCSNGDCDISASMLDSVRCWPIPSPKDGVSTRDERSIVWICDWDCTFHGARNVVDRDVVDFISPYVWDITWSAVDVGSLANSVGHHLLKSEVVGLAWSNRSWTHVDLNISGLFLSNGMSSCIPDDGEHLSWNHLTHLGLSIGTVSIITGQIFDSSSSRLAHRSIGLSVVQIVLNGGIQFKSFVSNTSRATIDQSSFGVESPVNASHVAMRVDPSGKK